ncbi:MAG TPA: tetratricopeptide repeat protein [Myxococcota bacterium]|nr:tetratricopeptide repeat protein [Myxococcota bacterium]
MTDPRRRAALAASWLLLAALAVYSPLRTAGFVWDDDQYVTANRTLDDAAGLARIWTDPRATPQYYPLVHTGYWLERRVFGLDARGYHLTNVLLHGLNAVLLWRVLARLGVPGALLGASLFAVHPVMVESVAWITERKNVLSLAFALGSLLAYLHFAPLAAGAEPGRRRAGAWALSLALFAAGLLSKTVVCTLPAAIAVLHWWKRGRIRTVDLAPLLPFFALGAAAGLHTAWIERHHVGAVGGEWGLAPIERVLLAGRALWFYAGKLAWPHPLVFFYPRWRIDATELAQAAFPVAAVAAAAALFAARGRIGRGPLAAVLIFAGVLFPALGFVDVYPFRYSYVADHFQYHAAPALLALFAAAAAGGAARLGARGRTAARAGAIALVAALGALSYQQAHAYRDLETLYRDTIAKNPGAWSAYLNLANLLSSAGRNREAVPLAREAARLAPEIADAHNTLGGVLFLAAAETPGEASAQVDEAIAAFARARALEPGHVDALWNGAAALGAAGRHAEAAEWYAQIVERDPTAVDARVGLGRALLLAGRPADAEAALREALRVAPGRADAEEALAAAAAAAQRKVQIPAAGRSQ